MKIDYVRAVESLKGRKMKTIALKTAAVLAFVLTASAASGCIIVDDDEDASLTIVNRSDFVLIEIRIARTDVNEPYGPNLIPGDLFPDESVTIFVDCDFYDVLIVDEDGFEFEIIDVDLCFSDDTFVITNDFLGAATSVRKRETARDPSPTIERRSKTE